MKNYTKYIPETEIELHYFEKLVQARIEHGKALAYISELEYELSKKEAELLKSSVRLDKYKFILSEHRLCNFNKEYEKALLKKIIREKDEIIAKLLKQKI